MEEVDEGGDVKLAGEGGVEWDVVEGEEEEVEALVGVGGVDF